MYISLMTDTLGKVSFDTMLDTAAKCGVKTLEIPTGGYSNAPHINMDELLDSADARKEYIKKIEDRGLVLEALNINGNQLAPNALGKQDAEAVEKTFKLAGEFGLKKVCMMSGLPGGAPGDTTANWIITCWPPENVEILKYQWEEVGIPYWEKTVKLAESYGIEKLALELHPAGLVYNVPTLLKLRDAVGPMIGANLDPSHLFFMGMDPLKAAVALGKEGAIYHVHIKDTHQEPDVVALAGPYETAAFMSNKRHQRSWVYSTPGYDHDVFWWKKYFMNLAEFGYDGSLSIEIEDVIMQNAVSLDKTVNLLREAMPDYCGTEFSQELLDVKGLGFEFETREK